MSETIALIEEEKPIRPMENPAVAPAGRPVESDDAVDDSSLRDYDKAAVHVLASEAITAPRESG